jgi:hypothetical protein
MTFRKEKILDLERGSTGSPYAENLLSKRTRSCPM